MCVCVCVYMDIWICSYRYMCVYTTLLIIAYHAHYTA